MRVATFNTHDNPAAVRRSLELAGVLLWQEFPPALMGYKALPDEWDAAGNPAATMANGWRLRWWDHVGTEWHKAHDGRRFPIGGTPARGTLVTKLIHRRTGVKVALVNGHRINRTRGRWRLVPGVRASFRAVLWAEHEAMDRGLVRDLVDGGWTVIGGMDANRRNIAKPHPRARMFHHHTIEPVYVVEPLELDVHLQVENVWTVDHLGSDHPARGVDLLPVVPDHAH